MRGGLGVGRFSGSGSFIPKAWQQDDTGHCAKSRVLVRPNLRSVLKVTRRRPAEIQARPRVLSCGTRNRSGVVFKARAKRARTMMVQLRVPRST